MCILFGCISACVWFLVCCLTFVYLDSLGFGWFVYMVGCFVVWFTYDVVFLLIVLVFMFLLFLLEFVVFNGLIIVVCLGFGVLCVDLRVLFVMFGFGYCRFVRLCLYCGFGVVCCGLVVVSILVVWLMVGCRVGVARVFCICLLV